MNENKNEKIDKGTTEAKLENPENKTEIEDKPKADEKPKKKSELKLFIIPLIPIIILETILLVIMGKTYEESVARGSSSDVISVNVSLWVLLFILIVFLGHLAYSIYATIMAYNIAKKSPTTPNNKIVLWILTIFAGDIGAHDFYRKRDDEAKTHIILRLVATVIPVAIFLQLGSFVWAIIESIGETKKISSEKKEIQ